MKKDLGPIPPGVDEDALIAGVDLVGRSGARAIEIAYDDDDPEKVTWSATATFNGAKLFFDGKADPVEAVEALARRLLQGARCRRCGKPIRLASNRSGCRWRREGPKWVPGCDKPIDTSIPTPLAQGGPDA